MAQGYRGAAAQAWRWFLALTGWLAFTLVIWQTEWDPNLLRRVHQAEFRLEQQAAQLFRLQVDLIYAYNYLNANPLPSKEQWLVHLASNGYLMECNADE